MNFFTINGVNLRKHIDVFMEQWEYEYSQPRAYDYARKAFRDYLDKGTDDNAELAAVHLYAYLACWGMCHHQAWSIRWKNYRIFIPIVKKLREFAVDKDYEFLLDYDPYKNGTPTVFDKTAYVKGVLEIVEALKNEFEDLSDEVKAVWDTLEPKHIFVKTDNGKTIAYMPLQYSKINDTDTLIGKILLVTFGCTVAYDSHVCKALKELGIKRGFGEGALEDFYDKVIIGGAGDIKDLDKHYTAKYSNGKYPYYPVMKLLDAVLWEYGAILP